MPNKLKDPVRHKFNKTKYKVSNSREYDQALKNRGSLTVWFANDAVEKWNVDNSFKKSRGGQAKYSNFAIEACVTIGLVFKQRLRQTEGLVESIITLLKLDLDTPDFTTISRRMTKLEVVPVYKTNGKPSVIAIDSTGIKIYGEQEWQKEKYNLTKTRKSWRKLHLAIDEEGFIVSSALTLHEISDPAMVPELLNQIKSPIDTLLGDGAYDQPSTYQAMTLHQEKFGNGLPIKAAIPPNLGFRAKMDSDSILRTDNILIFEQSRRQWQEHTDYGRRAKAENTMFRYKTIIGNKLKSRSILNQITESKVAVNILNIMTKLGMPCSKKAA